MMKMHLIFHLYEALCSQDSIFREDYLAVVEVKQDNRGDIVWKKEEENEDILSYFNIIKNPVKEEGKLSCQETVKQKDNVEEKNNRTILK